MDDGRIGHAELAIGDGVLYLADEFTAMGLRAPEPGWTSVSLMLHVPDTDAALSRARRFGAEIEREPYQAHGFRGATIRDPFGHRWMISGPVVELIRPGDIGYLSLHTPDVRLAAAFYGHVLGWSVDDDGQVTNTVERIALSRGEGTLRCYYAVTDIEAARTAIIAAGGRAEGLRRFALGESMDATDPDGNPFAVYVPESAQRRPALNGAGAGNCPTSPTRSQIQRCSGTSTPRCSAGRSSRVGSPTAGRSATPSRWPVSPAAHSGRPWCRCGRWPTSRWPCGESATPAGPCSVNLRSSPTA